MNLNLLHSEGEQTVTYIIYLSIVLLVGQYQGKGSNGIEDNTTIRIKNNQKIKGHVKSYLIELLGNENKPTYAQAAKLIKKKYRVSVSVDRIGTWWRQYKKNQFDEACSPLGSDRRN